MSSVIEAVSSKVLDYCGPVLVKHTHYIISPESYIDELKSALQNLEASERRLQHKIDSAMSSGYGIIKDAWHWRSEAVMLRKNLEQLVGTRHPTVNCFNGLVKIPRPVDRYRLAKQAVEGKLKVEDYCKKEKDDLQEVSYRIHHRQHPWAIQSVFVDLSSHTRLIRKALELLDREGTSIIGVHGIRGVGKSTLVRMIAAGARDSGNYDKVDIIMVSTTPDASSLHASIENFLTEAEVTTDDKLAKKLKNQKPNVDKESVMKKEAGNVNETALNVEGPLREEDSKEDQDMDSRKTAANIETNDDHDHPAESRNKRVLIIIDDLLEKIDLDAYIDSRKKLKVQFIVTSKILELLSSINCHTILPLNALGNNESRKLLTRLVGLEKEANLGNITDEELRKRCGGLPVFIEAVAQIMKRSNSANLWEDAVNQLPRNLDSMDTILELTHKQLDGQVKFLFSLCAILGGQTFQVQHLFRYSVGMGLFDKFTTMEAARDKMSEGLKSLLASSLLLGTEENNRITIEDARRDFAVKCAFKSHYSHGFDENQSSSNLEIFISLGKDNVPRKRKNKKRDISNHSHARLVHDSLVPQFAEKWATNKVYKGRHLLVLRSEEEASIFISQSEARADAPTPTEMESFFQLEILEKLKVVHLENLCFTAGLFTYEHQMMVLKDLVTLCLHNCDVKDMSGIGSLKSLQVVSFFGSVVAKLLKEFGGLKKLRSLDFRGCLEVKQIEPGALEGLSSLEELFLGRAFDKWEVDGAPHQTNASLAELNSMRRLATLDVCIPNPAVLPEHLAFSVLERYSLHIGEWDDSSSSQTDPLLDNYNQAVSRTLKLELDSSRVLLDGWFQATMKRAQQLHLKGLTDNERSIHELCIGSGGFEELKHLEIRNCPSTHYVVRSTEWFARSAFTCLEFLSLDSLMNLEKIGYGLLSPKSFGKLKTVKVRSCENLDSLFCISSIHGLSQLERIEIYECNRLQAIIVDERSDDEVCVGGVALLDKTHSLTQPADEEEEEEDDDDQVPAVFSFSKSIGVAFSKSLPNKSAEVALNKSPGPTDTESKANAVGTSKTNQTSAVAAVVRTTDKVVSPEDGKITMHNLRDLIIESSPNFSTFFTQVKTKLTENDPEDKIDYLPACLFCGCDKISFPKLESVALRNIDKLKEIWQMSGAPVDLGNLQSLVVQGCTGLLSIFHPNLLEKCLQKLESLTIDECPLIQEVFDLKPLGSGSGTKRKILPKLKVFKLTNLSNLKYIVSNKNPRRLLGFENLSSLDVAECGELEYIFTSSMAKSMRKLENISIKDCAKMKAIIVSDEVEDGDQQVGSKIEFPALKVLKIDNCPNMGGFFRESAKLDVVLPDISTSHQVVTSKGHKPSMMRYLLCYANPEEILAPQVSSDSKASILEEPITFFTQKVHLPSLVELKLYSAGKFTKIWHNEPQTEGSFSKLSSINVSNCKQLVVAFPAMILDRLEHLRDIEISKCPSLRLVFELQASSIRKRTSPVVFSHLKEVVLSSLSKLEHIVQNDTQVLVGFPSLTKIDVSSCDMLIDLMPVATATSLSNLETLALSSCSKIKEVVGGSGYKENPLLDDIVFPLLISLELRDLESLVHFSFARYQLDFPSLKILTVKNCMKMKIFSPVPTYERFESEDNALPHHHQSLFNERVGLPKLEVLTIKKLKSKELWSTEPFTRSFWRLKLLQVENCNELQNVIPSFMLKRLRNLEHMIIFRCKKVKHIVGKSDEGIVEFPYLIGIEVTMMPRLRSFCSGSNTIKLPLLKRLIVEKCNSLDGIAAALKDDGGAGATATADSSCGKIQIQQPLFWFDNKIAFPSLKELGITDNEKLSIIFYGQVDSLSKLLGVAVCGCNKIGTIFHSNVLRILTNLESLFVWRCEAVEVIFDFCGDSSSDEDIDISATATAKLFKLDLYKLPSLRDIWQYDPKADLNLEKLTSVEIWKCPKLEYIFRASAAKRLFQLVFLDIQQCDSVKKIVVAAGVGGEIGRETEAFVFPRLNILRIEHLEKLKSFSTGVYTVEWPLLSDLWVIECNSLHAFASYSTTFQLQDSPTKKPLFMVHKDSFPHLKKLAISNCSKLKRIWQHGNKFTASPFSRLRELEIYSCSHLEETLFPTGTVDIFRNLEVLKIYSSGSLKTIYDVNWHVQNASNNHDQRVAVKCTTSELKLKEVTLIDLPDLELIWNGELKGNLSFEKLSSITIGNCRRLRYLFSAREEGLKEVSSQDKEAAMARTPKLLFPRVTSLELKDLPEFKSLYPGPHISRWPSLKKMKTNCTSIAKLIGDFPESTSTGRQPHLFWADKSTFCLLKELTLVWNDNMEEQWSNQFSNPELFPQLQVVNIKGRDDESSFSLGFNFIHKVQIEKLTICNASCEVLFQRGTVEQEEEVQGQTKAVHFTELELNNLSKLIKVWEENYQHASVMFEKLKSFQVSECPELITLLPSQVLFSNLASLVISGCNELVTLMTLSTAKSLRQLSSMKISKCDGLIEIIEKNEGASEQVSFDKLKYLELSDLKILTSFCLGKCKLSFPVLQELVVKDCPWIKGFSSSPQALSTPILKTVQTEKGLLLVKGGRLNTTLMQFFTDQLACIETVALSDSPVWLEQWFTAKLPPSSFNKLKTLIVADIVGQPAAVPFDKAVLLSSLESLEVRKCSALTLVFETQRVNSTAGQRKMVNKMACFKNLGSITISGCEGLEYVLTTDMVLNLTQLRSIHITECSDLTKIVIRQDEVKDNRKELTIEFLKLETLSLEDLPKLDSFCQLSTQALNFPSLERISIKKCGQMKTFTSDIGNGEVPQEPFFGDKAMLPILEELRLNDVLGSKTIWHGGPTEDPKFSQLKKVYLQKCHSLKYVFPASAATNFPKLEKLEIKDCNRLEEIVSMGETANAAAARFVFAKVTILKLRRLPELKCFYPGVSHSTEWLLLKELEVSGCPKVGTLALEHDYKRSASEVQVDHDIRPLFLIGKDAFPKLEKMSIHHMSNMKRIWHVTSETDPVDVSMTLTQSSIRHDYWISTFKQLECLKLYGLPSLECFSSTSCGFSFASLNNIEIVGCPDMKFFSYGILNIPEKFKCTIQLNQETTDETPEADRDVEEVEVVNNYIDTYEDGTGDEEQFHDLNAVINEKSKQIAMDPKTEEKDRDEDAGKDGDADPDNIDDAMRV